MASIANFRPFSGVAQGPRPIKVIQQIPFFTAFRPTQIPGCVLWLDAADITTIGFSSGNSVNLWRDKSGNGRNMTATSLPTYNATTGELLFNGISNAMSNTTNIPATTQNYPTFVVYRPAATTRGRMIEIRVSGQVTVTQLDTTYISSCTPSIHSYLGPLTVTTGARILYESFANTALDIQYAINGNVNNNWVATEPLTAQPSNSFVIGGVSTVFYSGTICEIIVFNVFLTTTQRQQVESYLAQKWGLRANLPAVHIDRTRPAGVPSQVTQITKNNRYVFVPAFSIGNAIEGVDYTITTVGTRIFYNFLATGKTMVVRISIPRFVEYFAVGGGGGGGSYIGGGGGGGGLQRAAAYFLPVGTYNVIIGAGGIGTNNNAAPGLNGGNTRFGNLVNALGGGGGGYLGPNNGTTNAGSNGGCGGGAGFGNTLGGIGSQGFNGGRTSGNGSGGGGGTTAVGGDANGDNGGNGGAGSTFNNGTVLNLGGGGGGGARGGGVNGVGSFGGGSGARSGVASTAGQANRGGGGGGGAESASLGASNGGSGIFILALSPPPPPFVIGNATLGVDYTLTTDGTVTFVTFLATGKTMTVTTTSTQTVDYFAIGGGGAGGRGNGAGGGAGGLQRASRYSLPAGTYNVIVGAGAPGQTTNGRGANGSNTSFGVIATALGGGGGGGALGSLNGSTGGCGGGGVGGGALGSQGGRGSEAFGSGGGGGLGGVNGIGGDAYLANGGAGITFNNGSILQLGGGGGGQTGSVIPEGLGTFGGGNGGSAGGNGLPNTGGGGGGHGSTGGAGGSGIFILNLSPPVTAVATPRFAIGNATLGTDYTITTNAGRTFYTFLATQKVMTLTTTSTEVINYFAVGGGGSGGRANGGGGGAGGLREATGYSLAAGTHTIVVGIGGSPLPSNTAGFNGRNTEFGSIAVALGGGGGCGGFSVAGKNGGCGGAGYAAGSIGLGSQGFDGGFIGGGGGGGGGGLGSAGSGQNGGTGIVFNNGTAMQIGGGGGGQATPNGTASFGGGAGGGSGIAALANTGGGGGGGGTSGAGGSGIFSFSVPT